MRIAVGAALALLLAGGASHGAPQPAPTIAFSTTGLPPERIYTIRPDGSGRVLLSRFRPYRTILGESRPSWSPDGRELAFIRYSKCPRDPYASCFEVFARRADGAGARRITRISAGETSNSGDSDPAWSPAGDSIAFVRTRHAKTDQGGTSASLYIVSSRGGPIRRVTHDETYDQMPAWRPDRTAILFVRNPPNEFGEDQLKSRLMLVAPDGSGVRPFPRGIRGSHPAWSPDGRRVAFTSYRDRNGRQCGRDYCRWLGELYVMNADGTGLRRLTRNRLDDRGATWSPDGRWIAYTSGRTHAGRVRYRLYRISSSGGRPRLVVQMPSAVFSAAWRPR
jgi:TolB protein